MLSDDEFDNLLGDTAESEEDEFSWEHDPGIINKKIGPYIIEADKIKGNFHPDYYVHARFRVIKDSVIIWEDDIFNMNGISEGPNSHLEQFKNNLNTEQDVNDLMTLGVNEFLLSTYQQILPTQK